MYINIWYIRTLTINFKIVGPNNDLHNITNNTNPPLKIGVEPIYSGEVSSSCSTCSNRHVILATNQVASHEWGTTRKCLRQVEHIRGHLWHRYSIMVNQVMVANVKPSKWCDDFNLVTGRPQSLQKSMQVIGLKQYYSEMECKENYRMIV